MFDMLESAFREGMRGNVRSYDLWTKSQGIDPKKFNYNFIDKKLLGGSSAIVDNVSQLKEIVEFIGFYSGSDKSAGTLLHIPVIGVDGVGKSKILHFIHDYLKRNDTIKSEIVDLSNLRVESEDSEENDAYEGFLELVSSNALDVIILDECNLDPSIVFTFKDLVSNFKKGVVLSAWRSYFWDWFKESIQELLPTTKEIWVDPLSSEDTTSFCESVMNTVSEQNYSLDEGVISTIYSLSGGIPLNILSLILAGHFEAFLKLKRKIDISSVYSAATSLSITGIHERILKLTDYQLQILKQILLVNDPRGMRPSELVRIFGKDKATISYHLNELSKLSLLKKNHIGRWIFHKVKSNIAPFIALRLEQEEDFLV